MVRAVLAFTALGAAIALGACGSSSSAGPPSSPEIDSGGGGDDVSDAAPADGTPGDDAASNDGSSDADIDKSKPCVATFGQAIGAVGFARFDGTVVAILAPGNKTCTAPNATHVVVEMSFSGAVYRMVIDVSDTSSSGTIHAMTTNHDMVGGAWADGWHSVPLDYVTTLGVHQSSFTSESTAAAVASITNSLDLGAKVSMFATAQGENDSAHLVHRNLTDQDGAIVIGVDTASPTWLLFSFGDQSF